MKEENLSKIDEIVLKLPIQKIEVDIGIYRLVVTDADGIRHYFVKNNGYDGYSMDTIIPIEDNNPN